MTSTLVRTPLRTSPAFLDGRAASEECKTSETSQPLAYLYANWEPEMPDRPEEGPLGHFDPDSQTWVGGDDITAGVWTWCWCCGQWGSYWRVDDSCA